MISLRRASSTLLLSFALTSLGSPAHAGGDANARALAVQLFDEAEALLGKNRVAEACPKYAESYRLDPQLGVLIYLADCYEKNGQLASAWGSYREAEEMAAKRGDQRGESARAKAKALEPRLNHVVIQVAPEAKVPGLVVTRDGAPVSEVLWGNAAAIDPGEHLFQASAPGHETWQSSVRIEGEGTSQTVQVPALKATPASAETGASSPPPTTGANRRITAIAVGGLGIVGVAVGGFFGLGAQSSYSDSNAECGGGNYCTPHGTELRESAKSKALVATIASGVGVAALVTAGVLWFTAPKSPSVGQSVRARSAWAVTPKSDSWGLEVQHAF